MRGATNDVFKFSTRNRCLDARLAGPAVLVENLVANRHECLGNHFREAKRHDATIQLLLDPCIVKVYLGDAYPDASIWNHDLLLKAALD